MAEDKILTVSVAAYNVENYISNSLDSCLIPEIDCLDIIVVDDGATDSTAKIAEGYASRFPNSIRVIRKSNGGYGSTVNTSIAEARGRYFKLLDGDDWFDSEALSRLVGLLSTTDIDMVVNPFVECFGDRKRVIDQSALDITGIGILSSKTIPRRLSMHSITIRTELLRDSQLVLPEHRLYTDTLYNVVPLPFVKSAFISHDPVYQYRMGRNGQSMSIDSLIAHRSEMEQLVWELCAIHGSTPNEAPYRGIIEAWLVDDAASLLFTLFSIPDADVAREEVGRYLDKLKSNDELYNACIERSRRFSLLGFIGNGPLFCLGRLLARK